MTIDLFLRGITVLSALVVVWHCHEVINTMTRGENQSTRLGYLALVGGSAVAVFAALLGPHPSWQSALVLSGVAAIMHHGGHRGLGRPKHGAPETQNPRQLPLTGNAHKRRTRVIQSE